MKEQEDLLEDQKVVVKLFIDAKGTEMKTIIKKASEAEKNIEKRKREVFQNEEQILFLKEKNGQLADDIVKDKLVIEKYVREKKLLEAYIDKEMSKFIHKKRNIKQNIDFLKNQLSPNRIATVSVQNSASTNNKLLSFLNKSISTKERELECPLCLEVSEPPIFMCPESHLICENCKPKVEKCPECRIQYQDTPKRHMYAEKTSEELLELREKKPEVSEN